MAMKRSKGNQPMACRLCRIIEDKLEKCAKRKDCSKMNHEEVRSSSDLIRWLKMLALPSWAKLGLATIMLLALSNALGLLIDGMLHKDKDSIAAAVSILTVGLPVGLIVVALVFGDGGARKLRQMTLQVLDKEIPLAIRENLAVEPAFPDARLRITTRGYISDYELIFGPTTQTALRFRVELNVRKANVVFWLHQPNGNTDARGALESHPALRACLIGAEREGYELNPVATSLAGTDLCGIVFMKTLHEDFLLEPAQRIYFAQDFSFFVRGMMDASTHHA
jgi:hypothetical protein